MKKTISIICDHYDSDNQARCRIGFNEGRCTLIWDCKDVCRKRENKKKGNVNG